MEYHLYPPFFIIEPQTSFDKAWEDFCRQLLNLAHGTTAIRRRTPPDLGADLLWEEKGIIYQCKAAESGQVGAISPNKIKASIRKAREHQADSGWNRYVLCTNVNLTGTQEKTLRAYLPGIEFLTQGYWSDLCKKFHFQVADRFRIPVLVSQQEVFQAINDAYLRNYARQFQDDSTSSLLSLLVYSNRLKHILELPVLSDFSVQDVLITLREIFGLPEPKSYNDVGISVSLSYSLYINNREVAAYKKLHELATDERPLVTLWKTMIWYEQSRSTRMHVMEAIQPSKWIAIKGQVSRPVQIAIEQYEQEIDDALVKTIIRLAKK